MRGSPISKLHVEELYEIVQQYRTLCAIRGRNPHEWVKVARVCRLWREVVFGSPSLWTEIRAERYKSVEPMLSRSMQAPLDVSCARAPQRQAEEAYRLICKDLHRVRQLQLVVPHQFAQQFLQACKSTTAPELALIDVRLNRDDVPEVEGGGILGGHSAPRLQSFRLASHRGIVWKSLFLPTALRNLSVIQWNRRPRQVTELLSVLETLPNLETLHLEGVLPSDTTNPEIHSKPITLPIFSLSLVGTPTRCAAFLTHVRLPQARTIQLDSVVTNDRGLGDLSAVLNARLTDTRPTPHIQSLFFDESHGENFITRLCLSSSIPPQPATASPPSTAPERTLRLTLRHARHGDTVPAFVRALPLTSASHLHVRAGPHMASVIAHEGSPAAWDTAFGRMRAVQTLVLEGHGTHVVPYVLPDGAYSAAEQRAMRSDAGDCQVQTGRERVKERIAVERLFPALRRVSANERMLLAT